MTQKELEKKYQEIEAKRIASSVVTVDLWQDKTRDAYHHINIVFANNKLLYTGDFGTYVFGQDIHDVFTFFNVEKFDPHYWKTKCEAASNPATFIKIEKDTAKKAVEEFVYENFPEEKDVKIFGIQDDIDKCFYDWTDDSNIDIYRINRLLQEAERTYERDIEEERQDFIYQLITGSIRLGRRFVYCCEVVQWVANNLEKWISDKERQK